MTAAGPAPVNTQALAGGTAGYLLDSAGPDEVAAAVTAAVRGTVFLDPVTSRTRTALLAVREGLPAPDGAATSQETRRRPTQEMR